MWVVSVFVFSFLEKKKMIFSLKLGMYNDEKKPLNAIIHNYYIALRN